MSKDSNPCLKLYCGYGESVNVHFSKNVYELQGKYEV